MSAKEYVEAYPHMTEYQKDIMQELWWEAVNHDCHAWVKENDVKAALYDLFINIRTEELPIINELFKDIQKYEGNKCVTYGAIEKAVGLIVLGRLKNEREQNKGI